MLTNKPKRRKSAPRFKLVKGKIIRIIPEGRLQYECFVWLAAAHRNLLVFAVPNGGKRNLIEAVNLKRQGVKRGIPDVMVMKASRGYHGLCIELKKIDGKMSPEQVVMFERLTAEGYYCAECRTQKAFEEVVNWYVGESKEVA